ncbi:MAG TPA: Hsp20/alpha crystallin family protein [Polyangia bacterium]|nr:Hsp20/alpha crystallin family protein [Polyangia bacterium]
MRTNMLELMRDHVRAIHRSVTGQELPEPSPFDEASAPTFDEVARRFAELESIARANPSVAERVPPFSFAPPLDVIGTERELIFELGVPGIERGDVEVEASGGDLIVSGARSGRLTLDGRIYFHAEMARGPFRRAVRLPEATSGPPRVEVENGIIRIKLARATKAPLPRA